MIDIKQYKTIFFDFDGVIKDSVEVKTQAFVKLFECYGQDVVDKVRQHHLSNGGMSRYKKIPLYLKLSKQMVDDRQVDKFAEIFSQMVTREVIESPWVPGIIDYLRKNSYRQKFIIISATPQNELLKIIESLQLNNYFRDVIGTPTTKVNAIEVSIKKYKDRSIDCLMIGDAHADLDAAESNGVPFLLRLHHLNRDLFVDYKCKTIEDFMGYNV